MILISYMYVTIESYIAALVIKCAGFNRALKQHIDKEKYAKGVW